ncbi:O-antigen ligase family protein [Patescibacteria group bacterium]|nr:O-antigen ligase family protein [Patescibacteria group bacterium]
MGDLIIYLVVFLLVVALVSWRNLRVGAYLILIILPLYLIKFKFGPIPTTLLELTIYVVALVWLIKVWLGQARINWPALRVYRYPLLLILVGLILGTYVSTDRSISLGIIKGWFIDPIILFGLMVSVLDRQVHIKKAIAALMLPAVVLSCIALYQVITDQFITVDGRASAVFSSANYLSLFIVPVIVLGFGLLGSIAKRWRWWVVVSLLLMLGAVYFTFSYSGWLGLIVGIAMLVLCLRRFWVAALSGVGVALIAVLSQWQHPKFQQMLDLVGRSSSHVRIQVWQTAMLMIKENPLTGIGLGLFEKRYLEFASRLFSPPIELRMLHSHNIVLQFLVSTGLLGAVGFVWLVVNFARQIWQAAIYNRGILAITTLAGMTALLTHGMLDQAYWKNDLSALFWVIIAFGIILSPNPIYAGYASHHRN